MKRNRILLVSITSVLSLALIGGSVFASWAVTDNADDFNIKVTIGAQYVKPSVGYYLTFESDGYLVNGDKTLQMPAVDSNLGQVTNVSISNGDKVRIYHYDGQTIEDVNTLTTYSLGEEHGFLSLGSDSSTITFDTSKSGNVFSFYLNESNKLYVDDETYKDYLGYYITYETNSYAFANGTRMDDTTGSNIAEKEIELSTDDKIKIVHVNGRRGLISSPKPQGANYSHFTKSSYQDEIIEMKEDGTFKFMLSSGNDTVYISKPSLSSNNGYYIFGNGFTDFRSGGTKLVASNNNLGAYFDFTATAGQEIVIKYVDYENDVVSGEYTQGTGYDYLNSNENDSVITFNTAGRYDIYLNNEGKIYVAIHAITYTISWSENWVWDDNCKVFAWAWEHDKAGAWFVTSHNGTEQQCTVSLPYYCDRIKLGRFASSVDWPNSTWSSCYNDTGNDITISSTSFSVTWHNH